MTRARGLDLREAADCRGAEAVSVEIGLGSRTSASFPDGAAEDFRSRLRAGYARPFGRPPTGDARSKTPRGTTIRSLHAHEHYKSPHRCHIRVASATLGCPTSGRGTSHAAALGGPNLVGIGPKLTEIGSKWTELAARNRSGCR